MIRHSGRLGLIAVVALATLWAPAPPARAQSCSPRPPITVQQARDGTVTISGGTGAFIQLVVGSNAQYAGSATNVALDLPGRPPGLPAPQTVPLSPAQASYAFHLGTLDYHPVTVPLTITDGCGAWNTLVGGGSNVLPTHVPTATHTPTPTPPPTVTGTPPPTRTFVPTATLATLPTATPQSAPVVGFYPPNVIQGNSVQLAWSGRSAPTVGDYLIITDAQGVAKGAPVFTSSCTSTLGTTARSSGTCQLAISTSFAPGPYQVRYYGNNQSTNLLALASGLQIEAVGAALLGRGALWGVDWQGYNPDINIVGGYVGNQATIDPGDPGYLTAESWNAVGVADFALLGQNFVEVGADKLCTVYPTNSCNAYPYMSWRDNFGDIQSVRWSGGAWPLWPLRFGLPFRASVYELTATRWNGEFCTGLDPCCQLWAGSCTGITAELTNYAPATLRTRFPWIWYGSETPDPDQASGALHVTDPVYCCPVASSQWVRLDCWQDIWDAYDHSRVWTFISDCAAPGVGFDVVTGNR